MEPLAGWKVVIAAGAGLVGAGLVRAFRIAGATVIVPVRDAAESSDLRALCDDVLGGDLITEEANLDDPESAAQFSEWLGRNFAGLDVAIVATSPGQGSLGLGHLDFATWQRLVRQGLAAHFNAVRACIPWLNEKRGVFARIDHSGNAIGAVPDEHSGLVALLNGLGERSIRVIDVALDALLGRREQAYAPQDIGPLLVNLVEEGRDALRVQHRLPYQSSDSSIPGNRASL